MSWISVNEIPTDINNNGDKYNCVLAYDSSTEHFAYARYIHGEGGYWYYETDAVFSDVGNIGGMVKMTHWMPLPYPNDTKENNELD